MHAMHAACRESPCLRILVQYWAPHLLLGRIDCAAHTIAGGGMPADLVTPLVDVG